MELDVTRFVETAEPFEFSASRAERGDNAGPETWNNAKAEAAESPLLTDPADLDTFRDYMRGFGAWEKDEIDGWTETECNALLIQLISGDLREAESLCPGDGPGGIDWTEQEKLAQAGTISSRMFLGDGERVFYYVGE